MADNEQQALAEDLEGGATGLVDTLTGPQKAAAILVAIGRPAASRLLKHFNAEDLRKLAGHARTLEPISPLDFEQLVKQFEDPLPKARQFQKPPNGLKVSCGKLCRRKKSMQFWKTAFSRSSFRNRSGCSLGACRLITCRPI